MSSKFDLILPAFLELAEPKILQQVQCAVEQGAKHIALFPYFLAPGRHLVEDLPAILEQCQRAHPNITFDLMPHLALLDNWQQFLVDSF
mgnify:CR=1 FL=1